MQMLKNSPNIIVAIATLPLVCLVHPAIGLGLLLLSHTFHAHSNLCRCVLTFQGYFWPVSITEMFLFNEQNILIVCSIPNMLPLCIFYFIWYGNSISKVESCLRSFLAASFRSITQKKDLYKSKMGDNPVLVSKNKSDGFEQLLPMDDSPTAPKSFTDSQLELFDCRHGIMILHLLATLMFAPSLVAWLQVCHP